MRYGIPYKGSKNAIAEKIIDFLPPADTFVDLFAGGGAVTHCAMLSGKWEHFIMNDIRPGLTQLFVDIANGKYHDRYGVVTRDEFNAAKDKDWFVALMWSFGNNAKDYMYSKDIEQYKLLAHSMLTAPTVAERLALYRRLIKEIESLTPPHAGSIRTYSVSRTA